MDDLIQRLRKRAEIRRQIPTRKSVQEGEPDRIADLLEEAANALEDHSTIRGRNFSGVVIDEVVHLTINSDLRDNDPEPEYYMLTRDHTWLSCNEEMYNKLNPDYRMKCYPVPRRPLSDEKIHSMWDKLKSAKSIKIKYWMFARAIEERHGIK